MSPTVKLFSIAAAALVLAGCVSKTSDGSGKAEGARFFAVVDTAGATGRDSVLMRKLQCRNSKTATNSVTVVPGDPEAVLEVDGHRLEIPRGAVRGERVTFTMTHAADPRELRVLITSKPEITAFSRRLTLALSYESCDTAGIDPDAIHVLRNDRFDRGGKRDSQGRKVRAQSWNLSTYSLAAPT
jgi:hypothetical protein